MLDRFFSPQNLRYLSENAMCSARHRMHCNIHTSYDDPCQRLLNALQTDCYIHPHRHSLDKNEETLVAVRGAFALFTFNESGSVSEVIRFCSERHGGGSTLPVGVNIPPDVWHTVVALKPDSVLLEAKSGPFVPARAKELAGWAPGEESPESLLYLLALKKVAGESQ